MNTFLTRTEALLYELNTIGGKKHKCTVDFYELVQNLKKEDFENQKLAEDWKKIGGRQPDQPNRIGSDKKQTRSAKKGPARTKNRPDRPEKDRIGHKKQTRSTKKGSDRTKIGLKIEKRLEVKICNLKVIPLFLYRAYRPLNLRITNLEEKLRRENRK